MKSLKIVLVATLVAFAMVTVANADGFKNKPKFTKRVTLTIEKAMQDPGLVAAMYDQLDVNDVTHFAMPPYIFEVKYNGAHYLISGSLGQWIQFFRLRGVTSKKSKEVMFNIN
ncbi:MAG: hypothetical protein MUC31_07410 [Bacteroidales bacterium]|nr:hypothetical protein [Bacteroidales bacterium]